MMLIECSAEVVDFRALRVFVEDHLQDPADEIAARLMEGRTTEELRVFAFYYLRDLALSIQRHHARSVESDAARIEETSIERIGLESVIEPRRRVREEAERRREARIAEIEAELARKTPEELAQWKQARLEEQRRARQEQEAAQRARAQFERDQRAAAFEARMVTLRDDLRRPGSLDEVRTFRAWMGDGFPAWYEQAHAQIAAAGEEHTLGGYWGLDDFASRLHPDGVDAYWHEQLMAEVEQMMQAHARRIRLETTQELLATVFALGDGQKVTWGEASVDQHRQRITLLIGNATGNVETAARHQAAIQMIEASGFSCLREVAA